MVVLIMNFMIIKTIETQKGLNSTVPSKVGIDTRPSGPHFG